MRRSAVQRGVRACLLAALLSTASRGTAQGAPAKVASVVVPTDAVTLALGRAIARERAHDLRGVQAAMRGLDWQALPASDNAQRAALLAAHSALELGDEQAFRSIAAAVASARIGRGASVWTRWIDAEARLRAGMPATSAAGVLAGSAQDDPAALAAIVTTDTLRPAGRERAGAAALRLATRATSSADDVARWLRQIPAGTQAALRAGLWQAQRAAERGDHAAAQVTFEQTAARSPSGALRRAALAGAASQALEMGHWEDAEALYARGDSLHAADANRIEALRAHAYADTLWDAWRERAAIRNAWTLAEDPVRVQGDSLVAIVVSAAAPRAIRRDDRFGRDDGALVPPPDAAAWQRVTQAESLADAAFAAAGATRSAMQREQARLADLQIYLSRGLAGLGARRATLERQRAVLDSLEASLATIDAHLRGVRDAATQQLLARTEQMLAQARAQAAWAAAMRRIELGGTAGAKLRWAPQGMPRPDAVLAQEQALDSLCERLNRTLAREAPELLARSYADRWRPGLLGRTVAQDSTAAELLAWSDRLRRGIEAERLAAGTSDEWRVLQAQLVRADRLADSLVAAAAHTREAVVRDAVDQARATLESERERIDYGMAASAYARSVRLAARDTAFAPARVATARTASTEQDDALDDQGAAALRAVAMPRMRAFLAHYPDSPVRGEMRFRLADLEMLAARQQFRDQMAAYLRHEKPGAPVPVLAQDRALALYRQILTNDPAFPHRDAVLFDAGMILADAGDPAFEHDFRTLVSEHPGSPYCAEAWVRMGDARFQAKRYVEAAQAYAHATASPGGDPTLAAIADYKRGWSHFNEDRFLSAADAFRSVLDRYETTAERPQVDLRTESGDYLVIALAGAGGAPAFVAYFDTLGERPYAAPMLLSLAQHLRTHGALLQATQADEAYLARYPQTPQALLSAQRELATWERADRAADAQGARVTLAPRFAAGSAWARSQTNDSLRAAGDAFAHDATRQASALAHERARTSGDPQAWAQALQLDLALLAQWAKDPEAARFALAAGEASARLGRTDEAMAHYADAARGGADSIAVVALWQRVALVDAAYEHARHANAAAARGPDSLAQAVLHEGDAFVQRFPTHVHSPEILWREGQLALAHGWQDRASADLARFVARDSNDARAPLAASQRAQVFVAQADFALAEVAFGAAARLAVRAHRDTLARQALAAMPVCAYRAAEAAAATDTSAHRAMAKAFEQMAQRYPADSLAARAQYRASLAWLRAGDRGEALRALAVVTDHYARSGYARDAQVQVAQTLEAAGRSSASADAYLRFAAGFPKDDGAGAAELKAAELFAGAGAPARADSLRVAYMRMHPDDVPGVMAILAALAKRELDAVDAQHPLSALLPAARTRQTGAPSHLAAYLLLGTKHPDLVSHSLVAQLRFTQGEDVRRSFDAVALKQPLPKSIAVKKALLDTLLARYRRGVDSGDPLWAHASALRMGQSLLAFADALQHAERPADLTGADRAAYDDVLRSRAQVFSDRGVGVLTQLLRQVRSAHAADDAWTAQAQSLLWERLADRFQFHPEVDMPLVDEDAQARMQDESRSGERDNPKAHSGQAAPRGTHPKEGGSR